MGASSCQSVQCFSKTQTKELTIAVEDIEPSSQIVENDEQYDNPLHHKLQTNFLHTSITTCKKLKDPCGEVSNDFQERSLHLLIQENEKTSEQTLKIEKNQDFVSSLNFKQLYLYQCCSRTPKKGTSFAHQNFIKTREDSIVNKYQFVQKIGEGAYGKVYSAVNKETKEKRAIKVVKKSKFQQNCSQIKILRQCNHPNIIQIYQIFMEENYYYVVMEYCRGGSVLQFIKNNSTNFSQQFIKEIMRQLFQALIYIHNMKIIHRDIKLENMVFVEDGKDNLHLKIIDFGCAFKMEYRINKERRRIGTLSYMSPQTFKGLYSQKTDIWSCGIALYVLFYGKLPFREKDQKKKIHRIQTQEILFVQKNSLKISDEGKLFLKKLLDRDHFKRPTAIQCLKDPWLQDRIMKKSQIRKASLSLTKQISKYYAANNFVSVIESYISFLKVSQEEKKQLKKLFNLLDKDRKGTIFIDDIIQTYKVVEGQQQQSHIRQVIQTLDKDNSGFIDFRQFQIALYGKKKLFAFDYFDIDNSGFIEKEQFWNILKGCQDLQILLLLNEIDSDKDNKISKEEFVNYFRKLQKNLK